MTPREELFMLPQEIDEAERDGITPEMIIAGCEAWNTFDARFEEPEAVVVRIYRAMRNAASQPKRATKT
jgi:hypothetical protein